MGLIKKLVIAITILAIIGILAGGYTGFVPGISDLMGANKPQDLGVKYTASDLASANSKLGVVIKTLPPTENGHDSLSRSGEKQVTASFTSEELTALFNDHSIKWKYYPVKDIQVRIANDGTVEVSGVLQVDRFRGFADAVEIPEEGRSQVRPYLTYVSSNPSFYIKGSLSVTNNNIQSSVMELKVGKLSIPGDQLNNIEPILEQFIQDRADGRIIKLNSASFSGG